MNVMKQYAMDDKIKERCKTCKNNACKRISMDWEVSSSYRAEANPYGLNNYRASIE